jgi:hypothetical protein
VASKEESDHCREGKALAKSGHDEEHHDAFHADAEGWAERERERDLVAVLIEAAHLKSAAREWYRGRAATPPTRRNPPRDP